MIRAVIVDDEPKNIKILHHLVMEYCQGVEIIGEARDSEEAEKVIRHLQPDLVFLDIEMPKGNAFDTLTKLIPANFEVIFVTAFNEYAIRAFKFSAIDYLLKPVDIDELRIAVERAIKRIKEKNLNSRLDILLQDNIAPSGPKKIALPTIDGLAFYEISEIISCIAEGPYTKFAFTRDRNLLVTGALKEFEELLPDGDFCRIHHSCLINLNHIKKYFKGRGGMVEMSNGDQFEVSARKRDEFLSKFKL